MKGLLVKEWLKGVQDLRVVECEEPQLRDDDSVKVEVRAIGANFFDILMVQGKYQFKPSFPFIPGAEFSGVVTAVGKNVSHVKVGQPVFGGTLQGAYAEKIVVTSNQVYPIPKGMTFEEASGIYGTYPTSYAALKIRAELKKGEVCLVHAAAGGVGLAAVQVAKALGATVIATCGSDEKCEVAKKLGGADFTINYSKEDWIERVKDFTKGEGVDVVYDPVGLITESTKVIRWNGRILVIGFAGGKIPNFPVNRALLKNCSIVGFQWGAYPMNQPEVIEPVFNDLFKLFESGKLKPIVYQPVTVGLENSAKALEDLGSRKTYGKVVICLPPKSKI
jgi:NADPH2:quinone reductase